jgi:V/A-type H+-transporting ATPase subunit D
VRNVPPTRTSLLRIREELDFARLGHELLDQKRKILVVELLTLVDQAAEAEDKVAAALERAWRGLEEAVLASGRLKLSILAGAVDVKADIRIGQRSIMGVALPVVRTAFTGEPPWYSPMDQSFRVDAAAKDFRVALELMGRLAELKVSLARLAAEVRRTMRKVNALEKIAIPDLEETARMIAGRLEENERDMFALLKSVKDRLEGGAMERTPG